MKPRPTPPGALTVPAIYQQLLAFLLEHHYGLSLNDTPYHDEQAIAQQIEHGVTVRETVNELVEKFDLVRIDRSGFSMMAQDPTLNGGDMLRARSALGLRNPVIRRLA
ncbi:toxin [Yersinia pseudotuberculosis]|uniref:TA system toxin CbtA family protein n=1 Tax=Yersinia TaxID=629 RepID=UPI0005E79833|nr:TA system toxin CbtA family protein [Yersinia pseudotuberculosis]AXY34769.1 toxin [Yersinia pseudotuberculosis]AYX10372.1 toxin [Yersinia pseudotuberculosis]MBO1567866.1 toxin [Yersinia pseudotuberculosis]MBO1604725.1 toxin [Yersinia pseudotuberculosis]PEI14337.1 toxin [Yersinia pseudotuberculosis]